MAVMAIIAILPLLTSLDCLKGLETRSIEINARKNLVKICASAQLTLCLTHSRDSNQ